MTHPLFAIGLPHGAEWLYILIGLVILFGADKIPKLARGLGRSLGEFKKAKEEFEKEVQAAASEPEAKKPEDPKLVAGTTTTPTSSATSADALTKKS